jgi:sorting nexin-1/2
VENRRFSLERFLIKATSHPLLQLDQDLRNFLESETYSADVILIFNALEKKREHF